MMKIKEYLQHQLTQHWLSRIRKPFRKQVPRSWIGELKWPIGHHWPSIFLAYRSARQGHWRSLLVHVEALLRVGKQSLKELILLG